jgi:ATP-dependent Clp protease ATP-binding subunit ClpA
MKLVHQAINTSQPGMYRIYFEHDSALNNIIRKVAIAKWSRTHKCWWMPLTKENYNQLFSVL